MTHLHVNGFAYQNIIGILQWYHVALTFHFFEVTTSHLKEQTPSAIFTGCIKKIIIIIRGKEKIFLSC